LGGHSDGDGDGLINEEIDCTGILKVGVGRVLIGCTLNQEKNRFVVFDVEMFGSRWKSLVVDTVRNDDGSEEGVLGFTMIRGSPGRTTKGSVSSTSSFRILDPTPRKGKLLLGVWILAIIYASPRQV
jgi:hypothetical protein